MIRKEIEQKIANGISKSELNEWCQKLIYNKVIKECDDDKLKSLIKRLCDGSELPIKVETLQGKPEQLNLSFEQVKDYIISGIVYILTYYVCGISILTLLIWLVVGYLYYRYCPRKYNLLPLRKDVIVNNVDEINDMVCKRIQLYSQIVAMCQSDGNNSYPLETHYYWILSWLHESHVSYMAQKEPDEFAMESLEHLLESYGYELKKYSEEDCDIFDVSTSRAVLEPKTTKYALMNYRTNKCIIRGHVLCPYK